MKIGKVPENVLKRSVLKQIKTKRPEVILGAGVGEDCAAIALEPDEVIKYPDLCRFHLINVTFPIP